MGILGRPDEIVGVMAAHYTGAHGPRPTQHKGAPPHASWQSAPKQHCAERPKGRPAQHRVYMSKPYGVLVEAGYSMYSV